MKRIFCLTLALLIIATCFAGCKFGKFKCDLCGEEKFGTKNDTEFLGQTITYCSECDDKLDELEDSIDDLKDSIGEGLDNLGDLFGEK